jgi:hypothetical protein
VHRVVTMQRTLCLSARRSGDGAGFQYGHRRNFGRGRSGVRHPRPLRQKHLALRQSVSGAAPG